MRVNAIVPLLAGGAVNMADAAVKPNNLPATKTAMQARQVVADVTQSLEVVTTGTGAPFTRTVDVMKTKSLGETITVGYTNIGVKTGAVNTTTWSSVIWITAEGAYTARYHEFYRFCTPHSDSETFTLTDSAGVVTTSIHNNVLTTQSVVDEVNFICPVWTACRSGTLYGPSNAMSTCQVAPLACITNSVYPSYGDGNVPATVSAMKSIGCWIIGYGEGIFSQVLFKESPASTGLNPLTLTPASTTSSNTTPPPVTSPPASFNSSGSNSSGSDSDSTPVGAIAGGAVGGVAILAMAGIVIWILRNRRNKSRGIAVPQSDHGDHKDEVFAHSWERQELPSGPERQIYEAPGVVPLYEVPGQMQRHEMPAPPRPPAELQ